MKKKLPPDVLEYFKREGAKGGKAGAKNRMEKLSPEKRSAVAKKAATDRWAKAKPANGK